MGGCSLFLLFLWVRLCYINAFVPGRVLKLHQHGLVGLLAIRKQQSCPRTLDTSLQLSFSDEEDDGEEHEESIVNAASDADMSVIKEGIKPLSSINGSDVRVGIIMARWNSDVITGLHKVISSIWQVMHYL